MNWKMIITGLILLLVSACSVEKTYIVEEIDGVRHVHNLVPLWGDEQRIKLEFVQKIGGIDTEDENYLFFQPAAAALDKDGNLYISESGGCSIKKYDAGLNYVRIIGTKGQGPGELMFPIQIETGSDGLLYVNNAGNRRIAIFSPDSEHISDMKIPFVNPGIARLNSGKYAVVFFQFTLVMLDRPDDNILVRLMDG